MMKTRKSTKKPIVQDMPVEHTLGNQTVSSAKKRQADITTPKERRRGKPAEMCQLNLDVLFLVCGHLLILFRPLLHRSRDDRSPPTTSTQ